MIRFVLVGSLVVSTMTALSACGQGVGDRCQLDSDCQDDLICSIPPNANRQIGGTCQSSTTNLDMFVSGDFSALGDMSSAD